MHWSFWVIMGILFTWVGIINACRRIRRLFAEIDANVREINPENPYGYLKR